MDAPSNHEPLSALQATILELSGVAVLVHDVYSTPYGWNAAADALFRISSRPGTFERNLIVAGLTDPYYAAFMGAEWEAVSRRAIGMFRRAFTTSEPPATAQRVYDFAIEQPWFRKFWDEHSVAEDYTTPGPIVRHVPEIGTLRFDHNDLVPLHRRDLMVRMLAPHDAATRAAFPRLNAIGRPGLLAENYAETARA